MSRRIEVTVPNDWVPPVRKIIEDVDKCNLGDHSEKPGMVVELEGTSKTLFLITVPGPAVGGMLEIFRKNGIGSSVGRIVLTSVEYMKPDLTKPLAKADLTVDEISKPVEKKGAPLKGVQQFVKARKTTEEMYSEISNNTNMTINTWMNLIGASIMAAGGLTCNVLVFIVAAMLVSPIMGPILGMTMGYRVADFDLFRRGFINEMKMALTTVLCGCCFGVVLGDVGKTYKWPNDAMMPEGQGFNLIISIIVSAAAGMVLGVSLTATGGNALVGTAISAGLLPPLVNAGMMFSYASIYSPIEMRQSYYSTSTYNVLFYLTHVITIVIVANLVFWLKDVDPRFREGEDSDFNDVPALIDHKRELEGRKLTEKEKAEFFIQNVKDDLKEHAQHAKDKAVKFFNAIGIHALDVTPSGRYVRAGQDGEEEYDDDEEEGEDEDEEAGGRVANPLHKPSTTPSPGAAVTGAGGGEVEMPPRRLRPRSAPATDSEWVPAPLPPTVATTASAAKRVPPLPVPVPTPTAPAPRDRVVSFYQKHNPSKPPAEVDAILARYSGKESELLQKLHKQYNIPFATATVAPQS